MAKKENLTDMMIDRAYTDKDENGDYVFHKGKVLKFDYEGSPMHIKITRIDRKNKRMWGEHIDLYDMDTGMSHYGHDIDVTNPEAVYCTDCEVLISEPATEEGEVKYLNREREKTDE